MDQIPLRGRLLVVVLTGCGRKGDLERPASRSHRRPRPEEASPPAVKERRFILDGLLD
jgi:predicted small lipoprotein YifL